MAQHILINSAKGRVKDKNMRRDPRVGIDILDPDNPYRHLSIRGRVVEITENGADEHIDKLTKKYTGQDKYRISRAGRSARDLQNRTRAHLFDGLIRALATDRNGNFPR